MNLSVIIACHNRKTLTLRCIESARSAAAYARVSISFTVYDDGSTDGTSEAVSELPVSLRTLKGDGSAYWASGMAQAEAAVLEGLTSLEDQLIVWLNDDVVLDIAAFAALTNIVESAPNSVVVGAMRDPETGAVTYSGMRRGGFHPLNFKMISPTDRLEKVEVFNGNLVLVPVAVARRLGGIDGGFSHALADIDYGLRCRRAGVPVVLGPSTYGTCKRNSILPPGRIWADWQVFVGFKGGGNYLSLKRILRRSHRLSWPLIIAATYGLWWARRMAAPLRRRLVFR